MRVLLLLVSTFVLCTKQQTTIDPAFETTLKATQVECSKENGVEISEVLKIWTNPTYPADNHAIKCYYNCVCEKFGIIDNGKYDNIDALKFFAHFESPAENKEVGDECANLPPQSDKCEFAYQLYKCVAEAELD